MIYFGQSIKSEKQFWHLIFVQTTVAVLHYVYMCTPDVIISHLFCLTYVFRRGVFKMCYRSSAPSVGKVGQIFNQSDLFLPVLLFLLGYKS